MAAKSLLEEWVTFERQVLQPTSTTPDERRFMHRAYYAGAMAMHAMILECAADSAVRIAHGASPGTERVQVGAQLREWAEEIQQFTRQLELGEM